MNRVEELFQSRIFHGQFRVMSCYPRHTQTDKKYMRIQLDDCSGSIIAFAWEGQFQGTWGFGSMAVIEANGRTRFHQGQWVVDLREAAAVNDLCVPSTSLLPFSRCPAQNLLPQLIQIESQVKHTALRSFITDVFSDMAMAIPFLSVPGSLKHHHNEAGGLLRHSIECAQIAAAIPMLDDDHRDLAIIGALLHDIGKIWVFNNMRRTNLGHLVDHQALTLEVFALQLQKLSNTWPDAALALRHILTCRSIKRWGYEPRMAIASVVQMADKISVEMDMEKRSFADVRAIRNVSNRITNQATTFWRPSAPSVSENSQQM
jgi:23S rRNA maturation-related 3'-5' exoribonuclease YhaM